MHFVFLQSTDNVPVPFAIDLHVIRDQFELLVQFLLLSSHLLGSLSQIWTLRQHHVWRERGHRACGDL